MICLYIVSLPFFYFKQTIKVGWLTLSAHYSLNKDCKSFGADSFFVALYIMYNEEIPEAI